MPSGASRGSASSALVEGLVCLVALLSFATCAGCQTVQEGRVARTLTRISQPDH